jgi:ATP-dependent Lon protease
MNDETHSGPIANANVVPLLPLRDIVLFPNMVVPLFVGREKSIRALDEAMNHRKEILLIAQKRAKTNDPGPQDIFLVGTLGVIVQLLRLPDGTVKVLVEGKSRARVLRLIDRDDYLTGEIEIIEDGDIEGIEAEALTRSVQTAFEAYTKLSKRIAPDVLGAIQTVDDPAKLADAIVVQMGSIKLHHRQEILEIVHPLERLEKLLSLINSEIEILQVEKKIRSRVKRQMEKTQKEYYLNEQMHAIQKELGERDEFKNELSELEEKIKSKSLSKEAETKVHKELKKLKLMQPLSAEATVVRNYIDWVVGMPWLEKTEDIQDLSHAAAVLDEDHYGLKKIKERILEHLAVQSLVQHLKGPILCLVGPPGVGKTSLAKSIARATGRKFVRLSLGGMRDEAEIRGHRRTYIGAMPGRIIQSLRKAGTNNPVFLLDEIDKMSSDFRGDPAAALLEVLDPEQNHSFNDHYLDLDYDLSDVMFVTTANSLSGIPIPLQDRMEVIQLSGYTEFEKLHIARKYLVPRQQQNTGLSGITVDWSDKALRTVIRHYTKESGVRNLEREIGSICRKVARQVATQGARPFAIAASDVPNYLGVYKYRRTRTEKSDEIGLATGLAYTNYGGTTLECEVAVVAGKGKLVITGLLEKGMQESAQAAMSYIRSRQNMLGLEEDFYQKYDVHIHFPEFVPKDGPSAGITMASSIASALLRIPLRRDVAMTGEITLRGRVLAIGGLKEKLLAAHRNEIRTVIIPLENRKDLKEIPKRVLKSTRIVLVEHMDQVLREALALTNPDAIFGERPKPMEYIGGRRVPVASRDQAEARLPSPTVESPLTQQ